MEKRTYPLCIISTDNEEEDIIFIEYTSNLELNIENAKEIVANRIEFANDKKHYVVIDATNVKSISSEAKEYLLDPHYGAKNILGSAVLASTPVSAMIANIFIKSLKHSPSKFFSRKTDALKWIKELKKQ
jgi:anti-anti-sigma regulatory factor